MVERQGFWPGLPTPAPAWVPPPDGGTTPPPPWVPAAPQWAPSPPGWVPPPQHPSGSFPGLPSRPFYREPHPVATAPVLAGIGSTLIWLALFGSIARDLVSYAWWSLIAAIVAWVVALVLTLLGDRGVATGVALTAGFGLSIVTALVATRWITTSDWPMW